MTTRVDLRNLCRRRLGDLVAPYFWSDLQLNQWINDAVADYGLHFPRTLSLEIETGAGVHIYDLPADFQAARRVEYPAGENPLAVLQRLSHREADFWELPGRYDILSRGDGSQLDELWVSSETEEGETLEVTYLAHHASLDDDGDTVTVLDAYLELVVLFVRWAALQELAAGEARHPDPTSPLMSALEANALRAERAYRAQLAACLRASSQAAWVSWDGARVY